MLKNIRLHIEKDEQKQEALEAKLAESLQTVHKDNINAFQRSIPSLMPYITQTQSQNLSIFCNKLGHFNIVDYGLGRVLYGFNPEKDNNAQVQAFLQHGQYIHFSGKQPTSTSLPSDVDPTLITELPKLEDYLHQPKVPEKIDCLVILGIGLGYHIKALLEACSPRFVIIYEPEPQYFSASNLVFDWKSILNDVKEKDISLFFMLEKDGRDIIDNIEELREHYPIDGFYLYKHFHHPIFNSIQKQLASQSWEQIKASGFHFDMNQDANQYMQFFSETCQVERYHPVSEDSGTFANNIKAFETYFPNIAKEFKDYQPKNWLPVVTPEGDINIVNKENLVCWYSDTPKDDCMTNFQGFSDYPHKDGLILGYKGKKLAHYLHYKFVKETDELLEAAEDEEGALPENIQSMIMFGLGVGYQLEALAQNHSLEKLFLCEPNPDFFYASLYAIDWQAIFDAIDDKKGKLYINIGDDGTNLFRDLLSQFYSIGPYILNNTFFYQCYYNASLNTAIAKLREQLQVVITMGEYFDHAYHGIAQTKEALKREYPNLISRPEKAFSYDEKEVPVFLVGNGPSLDQSLEMIQEWKDKAIIVSCGTALQVMYRNGIVPDFHAEIEQNRSSFDWASTIGDFDYLKQVTLISCNGIHPDTCDLYKDVFVAFKEGESSTVSALQVIGEKDYSVLQFAFPTVANFACNLFTQLGFKSLYLIGIDMGFVNDKRHHSQQSAYYLEDGKELYEYSDGINTSFVVPGNFRKTVFTKHEFKIAKMVLEQLISTSSKDVSFFNCSDGAQIVGATPLAVNSVLITTSEQDKADAIKATREKAFRRLEGEKVIQQYEEKYASDSLETELNTFEQWLDKPISTLRDAEALVEQQKNLLFLSYQHGRSLLFYYLYGTVNFANAMLTKLLYSSKENGVEQFVKGLDVWKRYFTRFKHMILQHQSAFDVSKSPNNLLQIIYNHMQYQFRNTKVAIVNNSAGFVEAIQYFDKNAIHFNNTELCFLSVQEAEKAAQNKASFDYVIYHYVDEFDGPRFNDVATTLAHTPLKGSANTVIVDYHLNREQILELHEAWSGQLTLLKVARDPRPFAQMHWLSDLNRVALGALSAALEKHYHIVFLKYLRLEDTDSQEFADAVTFETTSTDHIYSHYRYVCIDLEGERGSTGIMGIGDRGDILENLNRHTDFVSLTLTQEQLAHAVDVINKVMPTVVNDVPFTGESH
ncbi:motility associated factor glycosyltransferase family protein [Alteromonas sp. a30]|uniref:motility associated factor glycosyltransferase family protein n=1 Tax=Alteromonas sp. a30 TaxID=2730917 RepID=UPI002282B8EC|nr:6-hydroxymethylpterin diphosphokinase MptE-like protein [Alteromonas sp. a30]MCY7296209.1 motility associated factor glycosyltransferase family protein [Alteromonas sp. a30]